MRRNPRRHDLVPAHLKHALIRSVEDGLRQNGWTVERAPEARGMSIRLIEKVDKRGKTKSHLVGIKTSQTGAFGFTRDKTDTFWVGLGDPEFIILSCVDDFINPRVAVLHLYDAAHVTSVFSRAYAKERKKKRSHNRKHTTGFFRQMHNFKPLAHPKYFGPAGILANRIEFFELSKYMQLGPGDLSSSIKEFSASRPGRSESKTLLVRSLGIEREKLSLTISKSNDESNSERLDAKSIGAPPANVTGAKSLFSALSRKAKSDIRSTRLQCSRKSAPR